MYENVFFFFLIETDRMYYNRSKFTLVILYFRIILAMQRRNYMYLGPLLVFKNQKEFREQLLYHLYFLEKFYFKEIFDTDDICIKKVFASLIRTAYSVDMLVSVEEKLYLVVIILATNFKEFKKNMHYFEKVYVDYKERKDIHSYYLLQFTVYHNVSYFMFQFNLEAEDDKDCIIKMIEINLSKYENHDLTW